MKAPASLETNDVHELKVKQFVYYYENGQVAFKGDFAS
jgi:hypothetical protein